MCTAWRNRGHIPSSTCDASPTFSVPCPTATTFRPPSWVILLFLSQGIQNFFLIGVGRRKPTNFAWNCIASTKLQPAIRNGNETRKRSRRLRLLINTNLKPKRWLKSIYSPRFPSLQVLLIKIRRPSKPLKSRRAHSSASRLSHLANRRWMKKPENVPAKTKVERTALRSPR